jgi:hypothetical protein
VNSKGIERGFFTIDSFIWRHFCSVLISSIVPPFYKGGHLTH